MQRRALLLSLAALLAAGPALPAGPVDRILGELQALGYRSVAVERTWLGRTRILAESREARREIVVNPATGEILRDLWTPLAGGAAAGGSMLGASGDDDDDDDDADDDDDDDDADDDDDDDNDDDDDDRGGNSGSGSDNSGGGNSGHGGGDDD